MPFLQKQPKLRLQKLTAQFWMVGINLLAFQIVPSSHTNIFKLPKNLWNFFCSFNRLGSCCCFMLYGRWPSLLFIFLHFCSFLFILIHICSCLFILIHFCSFLVIFGHSCSLSVGFDFLPMRLETSVDTYFILFYFSFAANLFQI